jgi:hypothetical protein
MCISEESRGCSFTSTYVLKKRAPLQLANESLTLAIMPSGTHSKW